MKFSAASSSCLNYILLFSLCLVSTRVLAEPNVVGTFSGTLTGQRDACFTTPSPSTNSVTLNISTQNGGSFSGTFTVSGLNSGGTVSGSIDNSGIMSGSFGGSGISGGSFSGSFDGSSLTIAGLNFTVEDLSMNCFDLGGVLNFTASGAVIVPETAPGTELKDSAVIRTEIHSIESPLHNHLQKTLHGRATGGQLNESGFLLEGESGLNAGSTGLTGLGTWLSYNYTESENEFFRTAFEHERHTLVGGVDVSPGQRFVAGLAFALETSDTDTTFNRGELESDGFTLAPYLGVLLSDNWSLDTSFGRSWVSNDQFRTDPVTGARISSDPDSSRFYISANLNGMTVIDQWILGGRIGYLFARSKTEAFTESDGTIIADRVNKFGQFRIGGDIAYSFQNWEPYVSAIYEYDFQEDKIRLSAGPQPDNDRDDIFFSTGLRYYSDFGLTASIEYASRYLREDFEEDSFTLTVRYDY
jgi:hypothetical protein